MNIIVCVKQVPSKNTEVQVDLKTKNIVEGDWDYIVNPCDEVAIEEAVSLKESLKQGRVTVVCIGPSRADEALRRCLSMGADEALRLWDTAFEGSDAYAKAVALAQAIKEFPFDLVLCGNGTIDGGSSRVGPALAELLGIPQVTSVRKVELPDGVSTGSGLRLTAHRKIKDYTETVECLLPALFAIERGSAPRYASLPELIRALKATIPVYGLEWLGLNPTAVGAKGSTTTILSVSPPKPRKRKGLTIDDQLSSAQKLNLIMSGGGSRKTESSLIDDKPEVAAAKVAKFLLDNKVIAP